MVGIRSITYQLPKRYDIDDIKHIEKMSREWDGKYTLIRTQRVCLSPQEEPTAISSFSNVASLCDVSSIRWFNVPIRAIDQNNKLFSFAYSLLSEYTRSFVNVIGVHDGQIDPWVLNQYADLMRKVSLINSDSRDNFRLGMSVNVTPDGPFFPFTYSSGVKGFSIALELTQDMNFVCEKIKNKDFNRIRSEIISFVIPQIDEINCIAKEIASKHKIEFKGFDFSLAPIIDPNGSVVTLLNALGVYDFGKTGSMFATSFYTNILKHLASKYKSVGFSGVMYSLLEDLELCSINNQRGVTLEQLISLSTMCGCGVDMVPVYGKMTNEEYMSIFLDIIGISCRLNNKPLGIRLLPIQDCKRGNQKHTHFSDDPDFIANTRVVLPSLNLLNKMDTGFMYI